MTSFVGNPFSITTPEDLTPDETYGLFINVFADFNKVLDKGHVFLMGPRGVGKSMMFKYLEPECQCLANQCTFSELPFIGVYIPMKREVVAISELLRLDNRQASEILSEHILVLYICSQVFKVLTNPRWYKNEIDYNRRDDLISKLSQIMPAEECTTLTISQMFAKAESAIDKLYLQAIDYTKSLAFCTPNQSLPFFNGRLLGYLDFLYPIVKAIKHIPEFSSKTFYLLLDDAHELTESQTRVLNSWVATRTSTDISLKISTQYNYKTFYTVTGSTIDCPHDYSDIDMATIYTGNTISRYRTRIKQIVERRFDLFKIPVMDVDEFFPVDKKQEMEIDEIKKMYIDRHDDGKGRGNKRTDDALRNSRPDYIKKLSGTSKSASTYSYAGFAQLAHISSGAIRYFLENAHQMYAEESALHPSSDTILSINPAVQTAIVRKQATHFLYDELERIQCSPEQLNCFTDKNIVVGLSNLMDGLGGWFHQILLSDKSERRVFSIAISDTLSEDIEDIMKLGVNLGFFQKSTIGKKDSLSSGRTRLYIMNRRLAPVWNLDPTGFAGYLFVTNAKLKEIVTNPKKFLRSIDVNAQSDVQQLTFFSETDELSSNEIYSGEGEMPYEN